MSTDRDISKKIFLPIISLLMIGFVVLDQMIKKMALSSLFAAPISFGDYFSLEIYRNYGIAFGLPVNAGIFYFVVLLFFVWLASGKLLSFREMDKKDILGVVFILSGALGNIIDRIRFGYIIDFVNFKDIVIFNLADIFIATGVIILLERFLPDTGKSKLKRNVYLVFFAIFGVLFVFLIYSVIEIWHINLLISDFSKYSMGLNWLQWNIIYGVINLVFFVGGVIFGYLQGKYWWNVLYEDR